MFFSKFFLNEVEHVVELVDRFIVTGDQLFLHEGKLVFDAFKVVAMLFQWFNLLRELFFSRKEILILFDEVMTCVLCYALNAYVFSISFAIKFKRLVMLWTKFSLLSHLFLLTSQL